MKRLARALFAVLGVRAPSSTPAGGLLTPRDHGDDIPVTLSPGGPVEEVAPRPDPSKTPGFTGLLTCAVDGCDWTQWSNPEASPLGQILMHRIEEHFEEYARDHPVSAEFIRGGQQHDHDQEDQ